MCARTHTHTHSFTYNHTHAHTQTHTSTHTLTYNHTHAHTNTHTLTYNYTHAHTQTHTHMYTNAQLEMGGSEAPTSEGGRGERSMMMASSSNDSLIKVWTQLTAYTSTTHAHALALSLG